MCLLTELRGLPLAGLLRRVQTRTPTFSLPRALPLARSHPLLVLAPLVIPIFHPRCQ